MQADEIPIACIGSMQVSADALCVQHCSAMAKGHQN
jgi:hypothetical protein